MSDPTGFHELRPLVGALEDFIARCVVLYGPRDSDDDSGLWHDEQVRDRLRDQLIHELARAFVRARA